MKATFYHEHRKHPLAYRGPSGRGILLTVITGLIVWGLTILAWYGPSEFATLIRSTLPFF